MGRFVVVREGSCDGEERRDDIRGYGKYQEREMSGEGKKVRKGKVG